MSIRLIGRQNHLMLWTLLFLLANGLAASAAVTALLKRDGDVGDPLPGQYYKIRDEFL